MATFTLIHVAISLVGIASGFVVLWGFIENKQWSTWTKTFLWTTVLTSVTGYGFPATHITPGHIVGAISLVVLALAIYAKGHQSARGWQRTYVINSVVALYLNFFVLIVQLFQKVPALNALAPTGSEPPFAVAQVTAMVAFLILGTLATRRFHASPVVETVKA